MKRCALYVRVSTEEQKIHGYSVDSQIQALQDYCKEKGYKIFKIYNDAGISARKTYKKRPALLEMVADCQAGNIDLILVTKLDRFFRSVSDYYAVMDQVNSVPWRAIWEDYETETSAGVFKVNIMLSVAQAESDRTSERIKSINEYRRAQGLHPNSSCSLGYMAKKGVLYINENEAPYVNMIFETYLNTLSIAKTIDALRANGCNISYNRIKRVLKSPQYYGNYNGVSCPAFITQEQHNTILAHLAKHECNSAKRTYYFSGLLTCANCNSVMAGHTYRQKRTLKDGSISIHEYKQYRCAYHSQERTCKNKYAPYEATIERYLLENIEALLNDVIIEAKTTTNKITPQELKAKEQKLEERLNRLKILFELGDVDLDAYKEKRDALAQELIELKKEKPVYIPQPLPNNWRDIYTGLDDEHKRIFWQKIIKKIVIHSNASRFDVYFI